MAGSAVPGPGPWHEIDVARLRPIHCDDLRRVGSANDGGYVVPERALQRATVLMSLGISVDWNFERDALALNPSLTIHAYDHTIGGSKFAKAAVLGILGLPLKLITMNPRRIRRAWRRIANAVDYFRFFRGDVRHFRQRVWFNGDRGSVDIATILSRAGSTEDQSVFGKIDIETCEYRVLPSICEMAHLFSGLAIEFHDTDICAAEFDRQLAMLLEEFEIVHIHGNNYGDVDRYRKLPLTLEISLLHKKLLDGPPRPYVGTLPREGLDAPNDPARPDYRLDVRQNGIALRD